MAVVGTILVEQGVWRRQVFLLVARVVSLVAMGVTVILLEIQVVVVVEQLVQLALVGKLGIPKGRRLEVEEVEEVEEVI